MFFPVALKSMLNVFLKRTRQGVRGHLGLYSEITSQKMKLKSKQK